MRTRFWPLCLLLVALLVSAPLVTAQDTPPSTTTLRIDGSETLQALLTALSDAYNTSADPAITFEIATNGPSAAFEAFCAGELDVVMATRYLSAEEQAACQAAEVGFIENVLGYQALVVLASASLGGEDPITCLSLSELDILYGFAAEGSTGDLQALRPTAESAPLTIYAPASESSTYALLESLLPSGDARDDAQSYSDPAEIAELLSGETPGVAVLSYSEYEALDNLSNITTVSIQNASTRNCQAPSDGNLETGTYVAQRPVTLYANQATLEASSAFLQSISNENAGLDEVESAGFTGASAAIYARNMNNLTQPIAGRTFSRPASPVVIDPAAIGEVTVSGSPLAVSIVQSLSSGFSVQFASASVTDNLLGNAAGWQALCDNTAGVAITTQAATAEQLAACNEAEVSLYDVALGSEAVVFVVATKNADLPVCLTTQALADIFAAPAVEASTEIPSNEGRDYTVGPQNWQDVQADFPDLPLYVLMPNQSTLEIDWLLSVAGQTNRWGRSDQEANVSYGEDFISNPEDYRAEAVANFEGGAITVMRWSEFQNAPRLSELRVLEVDNGAGCVPPTEASISDGSYPLSASLTMTFSQTAMKETLASAFMWELLGDGSISSLEALNLVGFNGEALRQSREQVFGLIEAAQALAAEEATAAAQATAEPTAEAEATQSGTAEAEATQSATAEATEAAN